MNQISENNKNIGGNFFSLQLNPKTKKFITQFSLSLGLLSGGNGGGASADYISPSPGNLILSPLYSSVPGNIWNNDSIEAKNYIQKLNRDSLEIISKSNIGLPDEKLKEINQMYIKLFIINKEKNNTNWVEFITNFIEFGKRNGLNEKQIYHFFKIYGENGFIPENITSSIVNDLMDVYSKEDILQNKLNQLNFLYTSNGKISSEEFKSIFKEYIDQKEIMHEFLFGIIGTIWLLLLISGGYIIVLKNKDKNLNSK